MLVNKMQRSQTEIENVLISQIDELSYIVDGLKENGSFKKLVEKWKSMMEGIDGAWHLSVGDPQKFDQLRMLKYATNELIHVLDNLEAERDRAREELIKLQNDSEFINKDVDNA